MSASKFMKTTVAFIEPSLSSSIVLTIFNFYSLLLLKVFHINKSKQTFVLLYSFTLMAYYTAIHESLNGCRIFIKYV